MRRSTVISRFLFLGLTVSQWRCAHKKHGLGVTLATRERNRKSLPVPFGVFCGRPACQIWSVGSQSYVVSRIINGVLARKKHVFGVVLATRERNRKSQPVHRDRFLVDPHPEFGVPGPKLRRSKTILWFFTSLLILVTSWSGAPCGARASISQIIYHTKIEKCWCKRSINSRHLPILK